MEQLPTYSGGSSLEQILGDHAFKMLHQPQKDVIPHLKFKILNFPRQMLLRVVVATCIELYIRVISCIIIFVAYWYRTQIASKYFLHFPLLPLSWLTGEVIQGYVHTVTFFCVFIRGYKRNVITVSYGRSCSWFYEMEMFFLGLCKHSVKTIRNIKVFKNARKRCPVNAAIESCEAGANPRTGACERGAIREQAARS